MKSVLTDSKLLLEFANFSVIESLRSNPELYNFLIYDNSNNTAIPYIPNYPLLISEQGQQLFNDNYTALILEEAEKLCNELITEFTNKVMAAAADIRASSLPLSCNNNYRFRH